ncbi:MAG: tetratricopeptide repeat protein [Pirellulales bacterium]|nr:tetratricopeptide repeat protein [Pirellulales bacterium]
MVTCNRQSPHAPLCGATVVCAALALAAVLCAGCKSGGQGLFGSWNKGVAQTEEQVAAPVLDRYGNPVRDNLAGYDAPGEALTGANTADDDEDKSFFQRLPSPKQTYGKMKSAVGLGPDRRIADAAYHEGERLFREKRYDAAAKQFKRAHKRWPDSPLEEDAMFMRGESLFFADHYDDASDVFVNLMKKYENSRHLDKVVKRQFAIARYWVEVQRVKPIPLLVPNIWDETRPWFDTAGNGLAVYESVWLNDPTGPLADDAVIATANEHFVHDRFEDADQYYTQLRRDYPKSEHQWAAHLLGLRAKLGKYQGPRYDDTPLKEAQDIVEQTLVQYPEMPADERERLLRTRQTILAQRGERLWNMGEHYAKGKYYRAAKYYYAQVLEETPDTRFAEMARQRLGEFQTEPDVPTSKFQWLVDAFPEPKPKGLPDGSDTGTARLARNPR